MTIKELKEENEKLKKELESYKKTLSSDHIKWYHREQELETRLNLLLKNNKELIEENKKLKVFQYDYMLFDFVLEKCKLKIGFTERMNLLGIENYPMRFYLKIYKKSNYHQFIEFEITEEMYNMLEKLGY